jgi:hypothetical protein
MSAYPKDSAGSLPEAYPIFQYSTLLLSFCGPHWLIYVPHPNTIKETGSIWLTVCVRENYFPLQTARNVQTTQVSRFWTSVLLDLLGCDDLVTSVPLWMHVSLKGCTMKRHILPDSEGNHWHSSLRNHVTIYNTFPQNTYMKSLFNDFPIPFCWVGAQLGLLRY